eukprot:SAG22_NODE_4734_length_1179_cov_0.998148_1_plen_142_part_00
MVSISRRATVTALALLAIILTGGVGADEITAWLKAAGLTDKQLQTAKTVCDEHEIERVVDLRNMLEYGTLDTAGFKGPTAAQIKKALGRAPDTVLPASAGTAPAKSSAGSSVWNDGVPGFYLPQERDQRARKLQESQCKYM